MNHNEISAYDQHYLTLKNMSDQDFLSLGQGQIAYTREMEIDGATLYSLHSADGETLSIVDNIDEAHIAVLEKDMHLCTVH